MRGRKRNEEKRNERKDQKRRRRQKEGSGQTNAFWEHMGLVSRDLSCRDEIKKSTELRRRKKKEDEEKGIRKDEDFTLRSIRSNDGPKVLAKVIQGIEIDDIIDMEFAFFMAIDRRDIPMGRNRWHVVKRIRPF